MEEIIEQETKKENQNKQISNLRMSITNRCNLSCAYCHKEGNPNTDKEMTLEEIKERLSAAQELKIKELKITGGEPLLRKDIIQIVEIAKECNFTDISITTNATLLAPIAQNLKDAGLTRINIGCDSLSENTTKNTKIISNSLAKAKEAGFKQIKLNMLVLKGINDNKIEDMIMFAKENDCILQIIELIPLNVDKEFFKQHHMPLTEIEKRLESISEIIITRDLQNRKQFKINNNIIETVGPSNDHFCKNCKKIRITADGQIKPCIMVNSNLVPFKDKQSILDAIDKKLVYNKINVEDNR
ncbi:MAG: GTP 3',8-cyclase MoaA [Candidatus Woesearchaeota archaeon]|jgi:cyclic pyranopterin phosphate synthase